MGLRSWATPPGWGCGDRQLLRCEPPPAVRCLGKQPAINLAGGIRRWDGCCCALIRKLCRLPCVGGDVVYVPVEQLSHIGDHVRVFPTRSKVPCCIDITETWLAHQPTGSVKLVTQ